MEPVGDRGTSSNIEQPPPLLDCTMSANTNGYTDTTVTFSTSEMTTKSAPATATDSMYDVTDGGGFFEGLLGCLRPVWTIMGKTKGGEKSLGTYNLFIVLCVV